MVRNLAVLAISLSIASVGLAPAEMMLCFHRDGSILVEKFQERCCKTSCPSDEECGTRSCDGTAPTSDCPDEDCRDLPLQPSLEAKVHDLPNVNSESAGTVIPIPDLPKLGHEPLFEEGRVPSDFLGPPVNRPETLLRTVILRL